MCTVNKNPTAYTIKDSSNKHANKIIFNMYTLNCYISH